MYLIPKSICRLFSIALISTGLTSFFARIGRPDLLASVILIMWLAIASYEHKEKNKFSLTFSSIFLGLLIITQPTVALLSSGVYLFLISLLHTQKTHTKLIIFWIQVNITAAFFAMIMSFFLYEYSFYDWILGLLSHAKIISSREDNSGFLNYFFLQYNQLGHGLILFYSLVLALFITIKNKDLFSLSVLMCIMFGAWHFAGRIPATYYNIFTFIPSLLILLSYAFEIKNYRNKIFVFLIYSISLASIIPFLVLFHGYFFGMDRQEFVQKIIYFQKSHTQKINIIMSSGLYLGSFNDISNLKTRIIDSKNYECSNKNTIFIVAQANTGLSNPSCPLGADILDNGFTNNLIKMGSLSIKVTPKAYNYAICACNDFGSYYQ